MVSKEERFLLCRDLRAYCGGNITPREASTRLDVFGSSRDAGVYQTVAFFQFLHEDDRPGFFPISRDEWNWLQRALLFLESGEEPEAARWRSFRWDWAHIPALIWGCFALWIYIVQGSPYEIPVPAAITLVAAAFRVMRCRAHTDEETYDAEVEPFAGFRQLVRARRRTRHFLKQKYPASMRERYAVLNCRPGLCERMLERVCFAVIFVGFFAVAWPIVLVLLCLPLAGDENAMRGARARD